MPLPIEIGTERLALDCGERISCRNPSCRAPVGCLSELRLEKNADGQYLLLKRADEVLAIVGAMGIDTEFIHFCDGQCYPVERVLDALAPS